MRGIVFLVCGWTLLFSPWGHAKEGDAKKHSAHALYDAIAAVVDGKSLTVAEVRTQGRLLLLEQVGPQASGKAMDARYLRKVLDYMVLQELLASEGRATKSKEALDEKARERVGQFRNRFPSDERYQQFLAENDIASDWVAAFARRDAEADAAIAALLPAPPPASTAEIDEELVKNGTRYPAHLEDKRRRLLAAAHLEREKKRAAVARLSTQLKGRHEVRIVANSKDLMAEGRR
jgi:hypothetical protein